MWDYGGKLCGIWRKNDDTNDLCHLFFLCYLLLNMFECDFFVNNMQTNKTDAHTNTKTICRHPSYKKQGHICMTLCMMVYQKRFWTLSGVNSMFL